MRSPLPLDSSRVYSDKLSGTSTRKERPGLAALLDYAREGDAIVVVGIDRLGLGNVAEVMMTIRELGERGIAVVFASRGYRHVKRDRSHGGRRTGESRGA